MNLASYKGLFSSLSNEYSTPQELFDLLDGEFHFKLDPCATKENTKCKKFYTMEDDGLSKTWENPTFVNPPYGNKLKLWVQKSYEESLKGNTIVMLIPSRTDTRYWFDYIMKADEIRFIKGRLHFNGKGPAPFPSAIVVFYGKSLQV